MSAENILNCWYRPMYSVCLKTLILNSDFMKYNSKLILFR